MAEVSVAAAVPSALRLRAAAAFASGDSAEFRRSLAAAVRFVRAPLFEEARALLHVPHRTDAADAADAVAAAAADAKDKDKANAKAKAAESWALFARGVGVAGGGREEREARRHALLEALRLGDLEGEPALLAAVAFVDMARRASMRAGRGGGSGEGRVVVRGDDDDDDDNDDDDDDEEGKEEKEEKDEKEEKEEEGGGGAGDEEARRLLSAALTFPARSFEAMLPWLPALFRWSLWSPLAALLFARFPSLQLSCALDFRVHASIRGLLPGSFRDFALGLDELCEPWTSRFLRHLRQGRPARARRLLEDGMMNNRAFQGVARRALGGDAEALRRLEDADRREQRQLEGQRQLSVREALAGMPALEPRGVPVPGAAAGVAVRAFDDNLHVLQTKTRPRKLRVLGSDGRWYPFLLKRGAQRKDAAVALLWRALDALLTARAATPATRIRGPLRGFLVLPLRDGALLEWVEGTESFYAHFRRSRAARLVIADAAAPSATPSAAAKPRGVAEIYHDFARHCGASDAAAARADPALAKRVLKALLKETPRDVLRKALWTQQPTPQCWLRATQRFCATLAAASAAGWTVGLGDRHLDNLLWEAASGDVVSIDFAVCFGAGARLRVPETVPFRMTPNFQEALGPGGAGAAFLEHAHDTMGAWAALEAHGALDTALDGVVRAEIIEELRARVAAGKEGFDRALQEAANVDNLSQMWEGFAAWF